MNIEIKGYKNLEDISLSIIDRKINMIFGMSGSGKSSISNALNKEDLDANKTIGKDIEQIVRVNGLDEFSNVSIFNNNTLENYLFSKNMDEAVDILIDSVKDIKKAEKSLSQRFRELSNAFLDEQGIYEYLKTIKKELGSDLTKKSELRATAKINDVEKSINAVRNRKLIEKISSMQPEKYSWLKTGIGFIEDDNCPFCDRRLIKKKE